MKIIIVIIVIAIIVFLLLQNSKNYVKQEIASKGGLRNIFEALVIALDAERFSFYNDAISNIEYHKKIDQFSYLKFILRQTINSPEPFEMQLYYQVNGEQKGQSIPYIVTPDITVDKFKSLITTLEEELKKLPNSNYPVLKTKLYNQKQEISATQKEATGIVVTKADVGENSASFEQEEKKSQEVIKSKLSYEELISGASYCCSINALEAAIDLSEQAILVNPNEPEAYGTKGIVYFQMADFDNALKFLLIANNICFQRIKIVLDCKTDRDIMDIKEFNTLKLIKESHHNSPSFKIRALDSLRKYSDNLNLLIKISKESI